MPVTIREVTDYLESVAPPAYQESYDNSGLIAGSPSWEVKGILVTLDCIEAVVGAFKLIDFRCINSSKPLNYQRIHGIVSKGDIILVKDIDHIFDTRSDGFGCTKTEPSVYFVVD